MEGHFKLRLQSFSKIDAFLVCYWFIDQNYFFLFFCGRKYLSLQLINFTVDQCHHHNSSFKINVTGDNKATKSIKQKSRTTYERAWMRFRNHFKCSDEFESRMPTEEEFLSYFGFLRKEKQHSSSSLWTIFSMLNSVCKGKYEIPLQTYPRLRCIIKSYDVDIKKKAYTFTNEEIAEFVQNESLSGAYWLVRKAIVILTYFGGLRHAEVMSLTLENICCDPEGLNIFHQRGNKKAR